MWTHFWDMHSGGGTKEEPYNHIYIEAKEEEAKIIFYNRFGHNPDRVSCTCCGGDYSISEEELLEQITAFHRGCNYDETTKKYGEESDKGHSFHEYQTLTNYVKGKDVLIIFKDSIKEDERVGDIPDQGYIWVD